MLMSLLKRCVYAIPGAREFLRARRTQLLREKFRFDCYRADFRTDKNHIGWQRSGPDYWKLSSELIFWFHKLEKGLCLPPGARMWFGKDAAENTLRLMKEWRSHSFSVREPVYQAALGTLIAYRDRLKRIDDDNASRLQVLSEITEVLAANAFDPSYATPLSLLPPPEASFPVLRELSLSRRSTRNFTGEKVDIRLVEQAISIAQLSPSACNRQPWRFHLYDRPEDILKMLSLQNGNSGFGHTVPLLGVMCCDLGTFFDSSERIEPILDGGLFLMSLLLALQSLGLSSCCLNWCVTPALDLRAHEVGSIPMRERILTFLAIGHAATDAVAPLSGRRPMRDVMVMH